MSATRAEGVIRFAMEHRAVPLDPLALAGAAALLGAWREVLARLGVLGQHPGRYAGVAYGNASVRLGPLGAVPQGARRFLVTATGTSGMPAVGLGEMCVVERWDIDGNRVASAGPRPPSSESLTHGALYDAAPDARVVLHGHAPELWRHGQALGLPVTDPGVAEGTPRMAREVQRLVRAGTAGAVGIIVMGGHPDGVLAFGRSGADAGAALVRHLARALELER
jgi:hypothetical protein